VYAPRAPHALSVRQRIVSPRPFLVSPLPARISQFSSSRVRFFPTRHTLYIVAYFTMTFHRSMLRYLRLRTEPRRSESRPPGRLAFAASGPGFAQPHPTPAVLCASARHPFPS
jgi:hypothetical protein